MLFTIIQFHLVFYKLNNKQSHNYVWLSFQYQFDEKYKKSANILKKRNLRFRKNKTTFFGSYKLSQENADHFVKTSVQICLVVL